MVADFVAFENFFAQKLQNERDDGAHCFEVGAITRSGVDCPGDLGAWREGFNGPVVGEAEVAILPGHGPPVKLDEFHNIGIECCVNYHISCRRLAVWSLNRKDSA